jgi:hypothetical protein
MGKKGLAPAKQKFNFFVAGTCCMLRKPKGSSWIVTTYRFQVTITCRNPSGSCSTESKVRYNYAHPLEESGYLFLKL